MHGVNAFAAAAKAVFISLQGLTTLVLEQRTKLIGLVDLYCEMSGMNGPLDDAQITAIMEAEPAETEGSFVISHAQVRTFLDGLGMWVLEKLQELEADEEELSRVLGSIGRLFVESADGITSIATETGRNGAMGEPLPPVLPYELTKCSMRDFVKVIRKHQGRLQCKFSDEEIDGISLQFADFLQANREEPSFRAALLSSNTEKKGFSESWAVAQGRFPLVQSFCGGLASAFPNTATVESDFSVIIWEKDDTRQDLTDFSLEGILHCKQYNDLKALAALIHE